MTNAPGAGQIEAWKKAAGEHAVEFIEDGMIVGLGYGSTAVHALRLLGRRISAGKLHGIRAVPTADSVAAEAREAGIPLTTLGEHPEIDLTIDGADEVDPMLNLIKGGGGALLKEKIVAQATRREIVVVDGTKLSPVLGTNFALPVEVLPFGWQVQAHYLESLGADVRQRNAAGGGPFLTEAGNYILDCAFGPINDPDALARELEIRAGIIEHGLFLRLADDLIVVDNEGIRHQTRSQER